MEVVIAVEKPIDDLPRLRTVLGFDELNLVAASAGTFLLNLRPGYIG